MKQMLIASAMLVSGLMSASAFATLANDMTCAQAQASYARNGRVYVETRMGDVVPVYGDRRACTSGENQEPVFVRTTDTDLCGIAYRCFPHTGNH